MSDGTLIFAQRSTAPTGISASQTGLWADTSGSLYSQTTSGSLNLSANANIRICVVPLNTSLPLSGSEVNYFRIPGVMNGWYLLDVQASCTGSSSSGSPNFNVAKINATSTSAVSMLTTNVAIDEGEYDSSNAKTAVVVSTTASSVFTGTKIKVLTASASTCGSAVTYAQVSLTFKSI
jgi:hypothetical protein